MTTRYDKAPPDGWWPLGEQENVEKRERFIARLALAVAIVGALLIGYWLGNLS